MIRQIEILTRLPLAAMMLLCMSACSQSSTYFVAAKNQQRYEPSDISGRLFNDDDDDNSYTSWKRDISSPVALNTTNTRKYRDSSILGTLYFDTDGEHHGKDPYAITIRKSYRSYNAETPLSEPIHIGNHDMTPHFSVGHHRDHEFMAGIVFRMPF